MPKQLKILYYNIYIHLLFTSCNFLLSCHPCNRVSALNLLNKTTSCNAVTQKMEMTKRFPVVQTHFQNLSCRKVGTFSNFLFSVHQHMLNVKCVKLETGTAKIMTILNQVSWTLALSAIESAVTLTNKPTVASFIISSTYLGILTHFTFNSLCFKACVSLCPQPNFVFVWFPLSSRQGPKSGRHVHRKKRRWRHWCARLWIYRWGSAWQHKKGVQRTARQRGRERKAE